MENIDRRNVFLGLAALMAGVGVAGAQDAKVLATSRAYPFDQLPVQKNENGGASRAVVTGVLPTGEAVEVHETVLPPGQFSHPPHKHRNSEFVMIRVGDVEFYHDGKTERIGPGGIMFNASNQMHSMKNVGTVDAQYFVVAIGRTTE
jgi:quercetin dioxygenase-like cupin family protein